MRKSVEANSNFVQLRQLEEEIAAAREDADRSRNALRRVVTDLEEERKQAKLRAIDVEQLEIMADNLMQDEKRLQQSLRQQGEQIRELERQLQSAFQRERVMVEQAVEQSRTNVEKGLPSLLQQDWCGRLHEAVVAASQPPTVGSNRDSLSTSSSSVVAQDSVSALLDQLTALTAPSSAAASASPALLPSSSSAAVDGNSGILTKSQLEEIHFAVRALSRARDEERRKAWELFQEVQGAAAQVTDAHRIALEQLAAANEREKAANIRAAMLLEELASIRPPPTEAEKEQQQQLQQLQQQQQQKREEEEGEDADEKLPMLTRAQLKLQLAGALQAVDDLNAQIAKSEARFKEILAMKDEEVAAAREECNQVHESAFSLEELFKETNAALIETEGQVRSLHSQLEQSKLETASIQQERANIVRELQAVIANFQEEHQRTVRVIDEQDTRIAEGLASMNQLEERLQKERDDAEFKLHATKSDLQTAHDRAEFLSRVCQELEQKNAQEREQLEQSTADRLELLSRVAEQQSRIETLVKAVQKEADSASRNQARVAELSDRLSTVEQSTSQQIFTLTQRAETAESKLASSTRDIQRLLTEKARAEDSTRRQERETEAASQRGLKAETDLAHMEIEMQTVSSKLRNAEMNNAQLLETVKQLRDEIVAAEDRASHAHTQAEEAKEAAARQVEEVSRHWQQAVKQRLVEEQKKTQSALAEDEARIALLAAEQSRVTAAIREDAQRIAQLEQAIRDRGEALKALRESRDQCTQLRTRCSELEVRVQGGEAHVARLETAAHSVSQALSQEKERNQVADSVIADLRSRLSDVEAQLSVVEERGRLELQRVREEDRIAREEVERSLQAHIRTEEDLASRLTSAEEELDVAHNEISRLLRAAEAATAEAELFATDMAASEKRVLAAKERAEIAERAEQAAREELRKVTSVELDDRRNFNEELRSLRLQLHSSEAKCRELEGFLAAERLRSSAVEVQLSDRIAQIQQELLAATNQQPQQQQQFAPAITPLAEEILNNSMDNGSNVAATVSSPSSTNNNGQFGIGILFSVDEASLTAWVEKLVPGGGADKNGHINVMDRLVAINGVDIREFETWKQAASKLKGPAGSSVLLTWDRFEAENAPPLRFKTLVTRGLGEIGRGRGAPPTLSSSFDNGSRNADNFISFPANAATASVVSTQQTAAPSSSAPPKAVAPEAVVIAAEEAKVESIASPPSALSPGASSDVSANSDIIDDSDKYKFYNGTIHETEEEAANTSVVSSEEPEAKQSVEPSTVIAAPVAMTPAAAAAAAAAGSSPPAPTSGPSSQIAEKKNSNDNNNNTSEQHSAVAEGTSAPVFRSSTSTPTILPSNAEHAPRTIIAEAKPSSSSSSIAGFVGHSPRVVVGGGQSPRIVGTVISTSSSSNAAVVAAANNSTELRTSWSWIPSSSALSSSGEIISAQPLSSHRSPVLGSSSTIVSSVGGVVVSALPPASSSTSRVISSRSLSSSSSGSIPVVSSSSPSILSAAPPSRSSLLLPLPLDPEVTTTATAGAVALHPSPPPGTGVITAASQASSLPISSNNIINNNINSLYLGGGGGVVSSSTSAAAVPIVIPPAANVATPSLGLSPMPASSPPSSAPKSISFPATIVGGSGSVTSSLGSASNHQQQQPSFSSQLLPLPNALPPSTSSGRLSLSGSFDSTISAIPLATSGISSTRSLSASLPIPLGQPIQQQQQQQIPPPPRRSGQYDSLLPLPEAIPPTNAPPARPQTLHYF